MLEKELFSDSIYNITKFQTTFRLNFSFFIINVLIKKLTLQNFVVEVLRKCIAIQLLANIRRFLQKNLSL